jgi:hypothetical protein
MGGVTLNVDLPLLEPGYWWLEIEDRGGRTIARSPIFIQANPRITSCPPSVSATPPTSPPTTTTVQVSVEVEQANEVVFTYRPVGQDVVTLSASCCPPASNFCKWDASVIIALEYVGEISVVPKYRYRMPTVPTVPQVPPLTDAQGTEESIQVI